jgi:solute carrier family 35 (UDP-sugar transporter), member A1/2/3
VALVPAGLYSIQNMAALTAYQNLDALTFNTLNQTKTLSAALCCYLVMGRKQSWVQVCSLFLLLLSALIMEGVLTLDMLLLNVPSSQSLQFLATGWDSQHFTLGVAPILLASFTSGLAGAFSQKNLQALGGGRNAYLFTMELCAASCLILLISLSISADGQKIRAYGFWDGWKINTFIPILSNSVGGIVVGLVTKHAGSVRKGFALIFGIFLSGVIQAILQPDVKITQEQVAGGTIAALSLYLHSANPSFKRVKQD